MTLSHMIIPKNYKTLFENIKKRICSSQIKAAIKVNEELLKLYWEIGKEIAERQEREKWGSEIIEKLGKDLQNAFPGIEGFSRRNIFRMRAFYLAYQKVPQAVAQIDSLPIFRIPWGHNAILIEKVKDIETRLWYEKKRLNTDGAATCWNCGLNRICITVKAKPLRIFKEHCQVLNLI